MWVVLGIGLLLTAAYLLYGLINKPKIKLEEEYAEYVETMETMRKADNELTDSATRKRLLDEDNPD